jgi:hypothetical protein
VRLVSPVSGPWYNCLIRVSQNSGAFARQAPPGPVCRHIRIERVSRSVHFRHLLVFLPFRFSGSWLMAHGSLDPQGFKTSDSLSCQALPLGDSTLSFAWSFVLLSWADISDLAPLGEENQSSSWPHARELRVVAVAMLAHWSLLP